MRFGIALLLAATAVPANAAVVLTGGVSEDGSFFGNFQDTWWNQGWFKDGANKVVFTLQGGTIANFASDFAAELQYLYHDAVIPYPDAGNETYVGFAACSLSGCADDGPDYLTLKNFVTDFSFNSHQVAFTITKPQSFDYCQSVPPSTNICANSVSVNGGFGGTSTGTSATWSLDVSQTSGVPEPSSWAMMFTGFALAGCALRRRQHVGLPKKVTFERPVKAVLQTLSTTVPSLLFMRFPARP